MTINGYTGKILRVDLANRRTSIETVPEEWCTLYLGGKGLAYKYLLEDMPPGADPLSPESEIVFMAGAFAGTLVPTSSRMAVAARSPATGKVACATVGGGSAAELKFAGLDGIAVTGRAASPVFLFITDQRVTLERANPLWGKGAHETERTIQEKKWTSRSRTLAIGPAGENLVPIACLTADGYRQAGRGGIGAVMGSKNLKAVAIRGEAGVPATEGVALLDYLLEMRNRDVLIERNAWIAAEGTPHLVQLAHDAGTLPVRNVVPAHSELLESIGVEAAKARLKAARACVGCPLACGRFTEAADGAAVEGPEYGTIAMLGANCGLFSMDAILRLNRLCDDLGLDTIATGAVLRFGMEMTEKGSKDFALPFGNEGKMAEAIRQIVCREEPWAELTAEMREAAERPRGASAAENLSVSEEIREAEAVWDSLAVCSLWRPSLQTLAEIHSMVTGCPTSAQELREAGHRIRALGLQLEQREAAAAEASPTEVQT